MSARDRAKAGQTARDMVKRVLITLPVLWLVVTVVFLLIHIVPGDPIVQMLGEGATATDVSALRHAYGLDAPLVTQYGRYWRGIAHADLGQSLRKVRDRHVALEMTSLTNSRANWKADEAGGSSSCC